MPRWISRIGARLWRQRRDLGWWLVRKVRGLPPLATPPVTQIPDIDPTSFRRSGYRPMPTPWRAFESAPEGTGSARVTLDLEDPSVDLDEESVAHWRDEDGVRRPHPVHTAQHVLAALGGYRVTRDSRFLARAVTNARHLLTIGERDEEGRLWFPYRFPHRYYDVEMPVPWWSAMAQGQALSVFTRLAELQPDEPAWNEAAADVFRTFSCWRSLGKPWTSLIDEQGHLWFEEYAGDVEPLKVMNGHIFALFGIYDYASHTGDEHACDLFDGGATTALAFADVIRVPGDVSYYCAREGYCQRPEWQNVYYHGVHIDQFEMLAQITGDERFHQVAAQLASDTAGGRPSAVRRLLQR